MHFALPPRKTSLAPPYARTTAPNPAHQRRKQIQYLAYVIFGVLTIYLILGFFSPSDIPEADGAIPEDASVLMVTVFDENSKSDEHISMIKKNREDYASRHGYKTLYTSASNYTHLTKPSPESWSVIPALRHALTLNPDVDYVWSLTPHAVITNPTVSLHQQVFSQLPDLMRKDIPVVPPDSVIHTFSHLKPSQVYLILTQDIYNVAHTSFILRNTETIPAPANQPKDNWSQYFLDAWFDPLYRAYSFQKAENHALEHIIQWHPTILAKLVILEQRVLNSYGAQSLPKEEGPARTAFEERSLWRTGDFIVNFKECADYPERNCEKEMKQEFKKWRETVKKIDGKTALH